MPLSQHIRTTIVVALIAGLSGGLTVIGVAGTLIAVRPALVRSIADATLPAPYGGQNGQTDQVTTTGSNQPADIVSMVKRVNPAVVSIIISKNVTVMEQKNVPFDPFGGMFGGPQFQIPEYQQNGTQKQDVGGGSGFLVSADGYIVTNKHVVEDTSAEYTVFTNDGKEHKATVTARDPLKDIAIIKIDGTDYPFLTFDDSNAVNVGQTVVAIGNALGEYRNTVSEGVISGVSRSITAGDQGSEEQLDNVLQTDAAINPGNSGGPLLNTDGNVIGVNVAVAGDAQGIGFALPANLVKMAVDSVKAHGKILRPFLGVRYVIITPDLKQKNHLTVDHGVLVERGNTSDELAVTPGSAADKAGIRENDIIEEADGITIDEQHSLASIIETKQVGDPIALKILDQGTEKTVTATLQEVPE